MNEVNNQNKNSNNVLIICITIIIVTLIAGVTVYLLNQKTNNPKSGDGDKSPATTEEINNNTNKEEESKEVEISNSKDYEYLIKQFDNQSYTCRAPIDKFLNINNLDDETKLAITLEQLDSKKDVDKILEKNCNGIVYTKSQVDAQTKKIFGKNTVIKNGYNTAIYEYNNNTEKYTSMCGGPCSGPHNSIFQVMDKVTQKDDKLYIYVHIGEITPGVVYDMDDDNSYLCYDFYTKLEKPDSSKCINTSKIDESIGTEKYIKNNKDKFAEYKYIFEKEDNNYIIKGLEKVK